VHNTKLITILTKNEAIHERLEEHNVRLGRVENDMSDLKIAYASKYSNYVKGK
jgi:hypothetical protein